MHKLASVLVMSAMSASAADFRALDIGQPCASVRELEVARGSTPKPGPTVSEADIYAFTGRDFDRDLFFSYFCMHGVLFTGNYSFPVESLEQAVEIYRDVHARLLSTYGDAFVDNSPWDNIGDLRFIAKDASKYMTSWRTSRLGVNLAIMPNQPTGWRVFLVIGPLPSTMKSPHSANVSTLVKRCRNLFIAMLRW